jgi:hypothetical protein
MSSPSEHPSERVVYSPSEFNPVDLANVIEHMQGYPSKSCTQAIRDATGCKIGTDDIPDFIAEFKARVEGEPKI